MPIRGTLEEALSRVDEAAVAQAIHLGACNIFHGCVHNMLYQKSEETLRGLYKAASFVLQAICFSQTGRYIRRQTDLLPLLSPQDRPIAETFLHLKQGGAVDFTPMAEALFAWAQRLITQ
jgi:hypothetical protein